MNSSADPPSAVSGLANRGWFTTTHWSVVLAAGRPDGPGATAALERLFQSYWYPLYVFLRRQGWSREDAEDLTQGFLAHLLKKETLRKATPGKGRFRSFLLASLKYYAADQRARQQALKRGGGRPVVPLDGVSAEERYRLEPVERHTPEQLFERRWALELLDRTLALLEREYHQAGQTTLITEIAPFLAGRESGVPYAAVARRIGSSEEAVKKAVQRLRRRYRQILRREIAHTVATTEEIEAELQHLRQVVAED